MSKNSYYISKSNKKKEIVCFELEKVEGYELKPKVSKKEAISVSKIVIVNPEFSEKIIRKKIDKKITACYNDARIKRER